VVKRAPVAKKPVSESSRGLVEAIVTVKHLQDFIKEHGSLESALAAVNRVNSLIELTGGVESLKEALEIVGKEESPPQP